jgi:hypothetical protein
VGVIEGVFVSVGDGEGLGVGVSEGIKVGVGVSEVVGVRVEVGITVADGPGCPVCVRVASRGSSFLPGSESVPVQAVSSTCTRRKPSKKGIFFKFKSFGITGAPLNKFLPKSSVEFSTLVLALLVQAGAALLYVRFSKGAGLQGCGAIAALEQGSKERTPTLYLKRNSPSCSS